MANQSEYPSEERYTPQHAPNPYASPDLLAADAPSAARTAFIRRTYIHLAAAVYAFVALEFLFFQILPVERITATMLGGRFSWLIVLGAFIGVSWIAESWAQSARSLGIHWGGW